MFGVLRGQDVRWGLRCSGFQQSTLALSFFHFSHIKGKLTPVFSPSPHPSQSQDTSAIVRNFLDSLGTTNRQQQGGNKPYTTLPDLLSSNTTVPHVTSLSESAINDLCAYLPHDLFLSQSSPDFSTTIAAMDLEQKRDILRRVLRSPQLHQSLGSLTIAIRDGGLSIVGEALGLKCRHVPQGGGEAVESFVEGAKRKVEEDEAKGDGK